MCRIIKRNVSRGKVSFVLSYLHQYKRNNLTKIKIFYGDKIISICLYYLDWIFIYLRKLFGFPYKWSFFHIFTSKITHKKVFIDFGYIFDSYHFIFYWVYEITECLVNDFHIRDVILITARKICNILALWCAFKTQTIFITLNTFILSRV